MVNKISLWFTEHLNWSIVIFTISISAISWYLIDLFLFFSKIPWWGPVYPKGTIDVILPPFSSFHYDAWLLLSDILLIFVFKWILTKKHRNKLFLVFFIIFLLIDLPVFLSYIINLDLASIMELLRYLTILLWLIGWIILLTLKNKSHAKLTTVIS
jgi:hypothetical protein